MKERLFKIIKLIAGILKEIAEMYEELEKPLDLTPGNSFTINDYECIVLECVEDGAKVLIKKQISEEEK